MADDAGPTHILDGVEPFTLVPFQQEDHDWCLKHTKNMLLYDRGLGKTVIATRRNISAGVGTHVVICPGNAVKTWMDHTREWWSHFYPGCDIDIHHVKGKPDERRRIWKLLAHPSRTRQHRLFVCNYGTFQRDGKEVRESRLTRFIDQWDIDEAHKLRNRKSKNFEVLGPLLRSHPYFSFETGTPISRGAHEFWTYLNCVNPRHFSSYWKHVGTFCEVVDGYWGKEIIGPRNTAAFNHILKQYARIRSCEDPEIAKQLPKKTRVPLFVELDKDQYRVTKELEMNKVAWVNNALILGATSMENVMRFRQLLVCPKMLEPSLSLGAAFNDLLENLEDMSPDERHTVVFTPFKRAFPFFREALEEKGYSVFQLSGGISPDEQQEQIRLWRAHRGIMLNTISYAESYSLEPAKTAYFVGYEWDPNPNKQAEDRLKRLTTRYNVTMCYYRYLGTVDDQMCHVVNWKEQAINNVVYGGR
jgi:SNF2 family DNA or RNA helicase